MNFDPYKHTISTFSSGKSMADIFHDAADSHLRAGKARSYKDYSNTSGYSCVAVLFAITGPDLSVSYTEWKRKNPEFRKCYNFLKSMGLPRAYWCGAPKAFHESLTPQQDRYTWLKTCAMIAEEEGL